MKVVLKPGFTSQKSQNKYPKGFAISKLCTLFTSKKNLWKKPKIFHYFPFEISAFNSMYEKSDKRCFNARAGKIHLCLYNIHRMIQRLITRYDAIFYPNQVFTNYMHTYYHICIVLTNSVPCA